MDTLPEFVNPKDRDYRSYHDQLKQYNLSLQRKVGDSLTYLFDNPKTRKYAFATTGSDGRLEKGPQSKIEVIIYSSSPSKIDIEPFLGEISGKFGSLFDSQEFKPLKSQPISLYDGNPNLCFPTRVLDSRLLAGNGELLKDAFKQLAYEFSLSDGKDFIDNFNKRARRAKKVCLTGKDTFKKQEVTHFDLDEGIAYYDCENSNDIFRGSFKYGPLRAVQYCLADEILRKTRNGEFNADFLMNMPTNISDRLFFFETEGKTKVSHQQLENLSDSYKYFLWLYHSSQERCRNEGKTELPFDKYLVQSKLSEVTQTLNDGILK